jgi:hypothetical protein
MHVIGHKDIGVDGAAILRRRLRQPAPVAGIVVVAEKDGAAIVAALDDVQRLIGEKIPAKTRHPYLSPQSPRTRSGNSAQRQLNQL